MIYRLVVVGILLVLCQTANALDSDSEQPATLDADDFEMDFNTGVRIYRGDVVFRQGSIRLDCDELTTYLNDNSELDKGICIGNPGKFKQRPEGQEEDVFGFAQEITMDQIKEIVTLQSQAKVIQGDTTITGRTITYDLVTEKVRVKGGGSQSSQTSGSESSGSETSGDSATGEESTDDSRPSLVIQPRKKPEPEVAEEAEPVEAEGGEDPEAEMEAGQEEGSDESTDQTSE